MPQTSIPQTTIRPPAPNTPDIRLAAALTYAGVLPFIACAVLAWIALPLTLPGTLTPARIGVGYGAVIAAFLCGIHWAVELYRRDAGRPNLLVASNVLALLAWSALLIPDPRWGCAVLAACFLLLFAIDTNLRARQVLPLWFFPLRRNATAAVVPLLALIALGPQA